MIGHNSPPKLIYDPSRIGTKTKTYVLIGGIIYREETYLFKKMHN